MEAPRFSLGGLMITGGALAALDAAGNDIGFVLLARHLTGDWGEVSEADWMENDDAVEFGGRIVSAYTLPGGPQIWVITAPDRSVTTILLPAEY